MAGGRGGDNLRCCGNGVCREMFYRCGTHSRRRVSGSELHVLRRCTLGDVVVFQGQQQNPVEVLKTIRVKKYY